MMKKNNLSEEKIMKRTVITVVGNDNVGIISKVSKECAECGVNIVDITQSVLQDFFAMVMLTDIEKLNCGFPEFSDRLKKLGDKLGLKIHAMHEDIFKSMHRI